MNSNSDMSREDMERELSLLSEEITRETRLAIVTGTPHRILRKLLKWLEGLGLFEGIIKSRVDADKHIL
ncbi:MAG: hypothetical protein P9L92_14365 [Candidatus Electryonea clarkiae]|nr:hypothetical protein [Candidatus Electryonea clarkiae]MDP8286773.1 hypothetical protein [Candidatus Electryonea clarkiae]